MARVTVLALAHERFLDHLTGAHTAEGLSQLGDVDLDRVRRRPRRILRPEQLDQPLRCDQFARVQEQHRQEGALLGRAQLGDRSAVSHLQRTE